MLGAGNAPAGFGPAGNGTPPAPKEYITRAISCREINTVTQSYVTDADGNPTAMDGTANRVYFLCAYADVVSDIITDPILRLREQTLRKALEILTKGLQPAVSNLVVKAERKGDGNGVSVVVSYFNNSTQQMQSVVVQ